MRMAIALALLTFGAAAPAWAEADEEVPPSEGTPSTQPYIDQIKRQLREQAVESEIPSGSGAFIENAKKRIQEEDAAKGETGESYTEKLRREDPTLRGEPKGEKTFLELEKEKLGTPKDESAIAAFKEGRSELSPKYEGEIHSAFGFRYAVSMSRNFTGDPDIVLRSFNDVYGGTYAPDFALFYEYQPWHSEWFGNIGLVGSVGLALFKGSGNFKFPLSKVNQNGPTGIQYATESRTKFYFFEIPIMVGVDYRFNLFRILRPFVMAGPTLVIYHESRDDDLDGGTGNSRGLFASGGVSLLMNWINPSWSWDQYAQNRVRHTYLTLEYSKLTTFSGAVDFSASGLSLGFTFEL